mgnify:CR=1 FL=1
MIDSLYRKSRSFVSLLAHIKVVKTLAFDRLSIEVEIFTVTKDKMYDYDYLPLNDTGSEK